MNRLFVALSLPEVVADALLPMQGGVDGAAWRPFDNFHITLVFIGDADRRALDEAASALAGVATPSFDLTLSGCGFFGGRKPRALWAGVAASDPLRHLQAKVETALRHVGFTLENRKYTPHVTLAYLRGVSEASAATYCARHNLFSCGPFRVGEFHLYQSYLGGEASHYEILDTYLLSSSR